MAKPTHEPQPALTSDDEGTNQGKGRPTPKRKEREAANLRPLVSNDRRAANKEARAKYNKARDRARIGMANGEEKYLPQRDKGPQRRFVRDYVDARFSMGELMIPVMLLVIVLTLVPDPTVAVASFLVLWGFFILAVVDCVIAGMIVSRRLAEKFGKEQVQKGVRWYTAMRCLQMRPMRLPKPQVKRGQYPA
ncbi:DUF3043 domain-containing protein [Salinibacterium sp. SYSU T00001]|uniref:DUF3043 domain-containing protein n=1 Tax=Homoserinimonas sedimenticola TaxID=2986805 RepID=UPI0022356F6E|nr:DUF3043 domain-containing protein [Salinibacterium sedimenticola]MCW4384293.1 DUF3043 domain-containing protein [Salinibacterium sedimenticola]